MRLLLVSTLSQAWGGSEFLWALIAKQALSQGNKVEVVVTGHAKNVPEIVELISLGAIVHFRRKLKGRNLVAKVRYKLHQGLPSLYSNYKNINFKEIDAVIISQGGTYECCYDTELLEKIAAYSLPYYLICQYHGEYGVLYQWLYNKAKKVFPQAERVFFVSERNKAIAETFMSEKLRNAEVINNPLRVKTAAPLPYSRSNIVNFACVARLEVAVKCQNILLNVLSSAKWQSREWHLNFYGSGEDMNYLADLSKLYGLEERVTFCGHVADIKNVWLVNNILLLPSAGEGCALSLIEAFGCGRTAVVTDVGGHEKLVIHGTTGFLAESFTVKYFDKAMESAWLDINKWQEMGVAAFHHLHQVFDMEIEKTIFNSIESELAARSA